MDDPTATHPPRKAAFLVRPHAGGTYTVYRSLRAALAKVGIDLRWIGESTEPESIRATFAADLAHGTLLDARDQSPARRCEAYVKTIESGGFDLVFVNVFAGLSEMSVPAYLPPSVRRAMIVHSISPATYSAAKAVFPYVHAAIGVSPRIRDDLVRKGLPPQFTFAAPNAIDLAPYDAVTRTPSTGPFRVLFLGRISDMDKGVFLLPSIMKRLAGGNIHLTIAGDGPDLPALQAQCTPLASQITFLGRVDAAQVPTLSASHDVLLMPSRFEGFGYSLIEAMAAGCVPIASRIAGATDFIVKDQATGLLFPVGDVPAAVAAIERLARDKDLWQKMSESGKRDVQERFSIDSLVRSYQPILKTLENPRSLRPTPVDSTFQPLNFGGAWRRLVPRSLKNFLRTRLTR